MSPNPNPNPKPQKKKKLEAPPEHSVWLRVVGCITSVIGVGAACAFVETSIPMTILFIWGTITGNYISYHYRNKNPWWLIFVFLLLFLGVTGLCLNDLISMFEFGQLAILTPVVHYFAGVLVVHTFELRSRADIYTSQIMGLIVLATAAPLCKSMVFGALVLAYVCLGAVFFYIDARTRYVDEAEKRKQSNLFAISFVQRTNFRPSTGSTIASLVALPLASILLFMLMPRFDLNELLNKWLNPKPEKISVPQNFTPKSNTKTFQNPNKEKTKPLQPPKKKEEPKPKPKKEEKKPEQKKKEQKKGQPKKEPQKVPQKQAEKKAEAKKEQKKIEQKKKEQQKQEKEKQKEKPQKVEKPKHIKRKLDGGATNDYPVNEKVTISQEFKPVKDLVMKIRCVRASYVTRDYFDFFDGETWTKSDTAEPQNLLKPNDRSPFDLSHANALKLPDDFASTEIFEEFMVATDMDNNISFEGFPQKTDYPTETLGVTSYGSLLADSIVKSKTNYKVTAKFGIYDFDKMRAAPPFDEKTMEYFRDKYSQYLQTFDEQDSRISKLAFEVSDPAPNWFTKAEEVANYLRKNYVYDLSKKGEDDQNNPLDYFLYRSKKGDCKDFASAFVMMTRHLGIPSRIVTGFVPGKVNEVTGLREVRRKDAHMWAQVYIPGYEWIDFDATPGAELPVKPKEKQYDIQTVTGHKIDWKKLWMLFLKYATDILAIILIIAFALFIRHKILAYLAKQREKMQGTLARRLYLRIFALLKKNANMTRGTSETYKEFTKRLAKKNEELTLAGKPCYPTIPDPLDLFLAEYAAIYFGKKKDTKDLERHAGTCLYILGEKPTAPTNAVRTPAASGKNGSGNGRRV
jgi:hypothetical protein